MTRRTTAAARTALALATIVGVLLAGTPARAGGWWAYIDLETRYLVVGETIELDAGEIMFERIAEAQAARTGGRQYYAFLIPDLDWGIVEAAMGKPDPEGWWEQPAVAYRIGDVRVTGGSSNLMRAQATLEVPDLTPGEYALMLCDAGCRESLADLIPAEVTLTTDAESAQALRRLASLTARVERQQRELARQERFFEKELAEQEALVGQAAADVKRLRETLQQLAEDSGDRPEEPWLLPAVGLLIGLVGGGLIVRSRRRRPPTVRPRSVERPGERRTLGTAIASPDRGGDEELGKPLVPSRS